MSYDINPARPGRRMRKVRKDTKFDYKYVRQLAGGIRYKYGLSEIELCRKWKITRTTYYKWMQRYPDFAYAHELGKQDYATYWHENFKGIANGEIKGNAGCAIFAMTNIEGINWSNKVNVHNTSEEEVRHVKIELLPNAGRLIEHQPAEEIPLSTNILEFTKV